MIDGLHIPIWNRTKESLAIALSGVGRGLRGRDDRGNVTNVPYKSNYIYSDNIVTIYIMNTQEWI
jgi:hypothetical protein